VNDISHEDERPAAQEAAGGGGQPAEAAPAKNTIEELAGENSRLRVANAKLRAGNKAFFDLLSSLYLQRADLWDELAAINPELERLVKENALRVEDGLLIVEDRDQSGGGLERIRKENGQPAKEGAALHEKELEEIHGLREDNKGLLDKIDELLKDNKDLLDEIDDLESMIDGLEADIYILHGESWDLSRKLREARLPLAM
jgi:regulator of replication initiation timing